MSAAGVSSAKANGSRPNGRASGPTSLAVLHVQEGRHRLLIARRRERWEVVESRTMQGFDPIVLGPLFEEHEVARVIRIAPGRETVARCVQVPGGDEASLVGAVALMAEVELPATLPAYRRAAGVLPGAPSAENRTGLLTGWMPGASIPTSASPRPEVWITPVAALALLRGDSGRTAAYCEQAEGLVCLLVPGPERTVGRVLVEEPGDGDEWGERVARSIEETVLMAGATSAAAAAFNASHHASDRKRLLLEPASLSNLKVRISGVRDDSGWLDDFGLCLGAVLVAGSDQPSIQSLANLHAETPRQQLSPVEAATLWLSRPRNAWGVVAASLAIMLLAPIGLAYGRATILKGRAEALKDFKVGHEGLEKKAAMYEQLERSRWPMTKLLSDISVSTPEGVVITNLQLATGQNVVLEGMADSAEVLNQLQSNLVATRIFGNVTINRQNVKGSGYDFSISARIPTSSATAHVPVKLTPENNFAEKPLAVRLHGEGASNKVAPSTSVSAETSGSHRRRGPETRSERASTDSGGTEKGATRGDSSRRPEGANTKSSAVPAALTDADIAKLTLVEAMKEWSSRKSYVQTNPTLDAATKQRLTEESEKCKAQMEKLKVSGASNAAPAGGSK